MNRAPDGFALVGRVGDLPPGAFLEVEIDDEVLLLTHVESGFHAVTVWCAHQGSSLALGTLQDTVIQCWAHLWRFDVRTGEPIWPPMARVAPGYRLRVHEVRVVDDEVYVSKTPRLGRT